MRDPDHRLRIREWSSDPRPFKDSPHVSKVTSQQTAAIAKVASLLVLHRAEYIRMIQKGSPVKIRCQVVSSLVSQVGHVGAMAHPEEEETDQCNHD